MAIVNYSVYVRYTKEGVGIGIERYEKPNSPLYEKVIQATGGPVTIFGSMYLPKGYGIKKASRAVFEYIDWLEPTNEPIHITANTNGLNADYKEEFDRIFYVAKKPAKDLKRGYIKELANDAIERGYTMDNWLYDIKQDY